MTAWALFWIILIFVLCYGDAGVYVMVGFALWGALACYRVSPRFWSDEGPAARTAKAISRKLGSSRAS